VEVPRDGGSSACSSTSTIEVRPVTDDATLRALDNPIWSSLAMRHAHFAVGDALARRYRSDISPLAALPGDARENVDALDKLFGVGDAMTLAGPYVPGLGAHWEPLHVSRATQMIRVEAAPLGEGDVDAVALGPDDVPDMLALVDLTQPGPFRPRTIELGRFIGIREAGKLVAMAGERMWIGGCREVSGVCTHPDAQRRGYAKALMARVINRMLRVGETPFLHVESTNTRAIDVYGALGFVKRAEFPLLYAQRIA
jgi:ribosomal protein S18 acetylase RimI-like enzyme